MNNSTLNALISVKWKVIIIIYHACWKWHVDNLVYMILTSQTWSCRNWLRQIDKSGMTKLLQRWMHTRRNWKNITNPLLQNWTRKQNNELKETCRMFNMFKSIEHHYCFLDLFSPSMWCVFPSANMRCGISNYGWNGNFYFWRSLNWSDHGIWHAKVL